MSLSVDIHKDLGGFQLDAAFSVGDETLALLGASGCGKSLTLACVAGIVRPDRGRIVLDGVTLFDSEERVDLSPQERQTGLMFQHYALFPNMTVEQNLRAGLRRRGAEARPEAEEMLRRFGLERVRTLYPSQISGGQQQRAALARMLLSRPRLLMFDEPFSALDSHLRFSMEQEILDVIRSFVGTVLLVSHDQDEVFRLSDRIAVMHDGRVEAEGPKGDLFRAPQTRQGAILTGCKNISRAVLRGGRVWAADWGVELDVPRWADDAAYLGIRMHDVVHEDRGNRLSCRVLREIEGPFSTVVMLAPEGAGEGSTPIGWELEKGLWLRLRSSRVAVSLPPDSILTLRE